MTSKAMKQGKIKARRILTKPCMDKVEMESLDRFLIAFFTPLWEYKRLHPEFDLRAEFEKRKQAK